MRQICMSGSMSGVWKRSHGRTSEAPPDERGGYRYVRPTATAPHLDSTLSRLPVRASNTTYPDKLRRLGCKKILNWESYYLSCGYTDVTSFPSASPPVARKRLS